MEGHQMFLSNNIFDIDSALDQLEENLFTGSESKPSSAAAAISHEKKFEQPRIDKEQQQQDQQQCSEENGNENETNASKLRTLHVVANKEISSDSSSDDDLNVNIENRAIPSSNESSPPIHEEMATERTETVDLAATQAITLTSLSIDDKITTTLASSDSSDTSSSSSSDSEGEEFIPPESSTANLHDDSTKPLISEESINQQIDLPKESIEIVDDQPVTADLTLTKTVELTENEPDPEDDPVAVNVAEQNEQKTVQVEEKQEPKQFEIAAVKPIVMMVEEPREIEISQYNFESTMDDISDAELESLEQELEELVAAAEHNATSEPKKSEIVSDVKEDEVKEEPVKVATVEAAEAEIGEKEMKPVEVIVETAKNEVEIVEEKTAAAVEVTPIVETENFVEKMETTESEKSVEVPAETEEKHEEVVEETTEAIDDPPSVQESVSEAHEAIEPPTEGLSSSDDSASIRNIPSQSHDEYSINESNSTGSLTSAPDLGRVPPYWIPDNMTNQCMICEAKFNTFRRRHHCRACGLLLCANCCSEKFELHYLNGEGRVCKPCFEQLTKLQQQQQNQPNQARRQPNPGNPMEYCSTIPPQQQVNPANPPLTIMVPTSVLKRGPRTSERKSVIFSDGIRPGTDFDPAESSPRSSPEKTSNKVNIPKLSEKTQSFIPDKDHDLPPMLLKENDYRYVDNNLQLLQRLRQEEMRFAINKNFIVTVKIVTREYDEGFYLFV